MIDKKEFEKAKEAVIAFKKKQQELLTLKKQDIAALNLITHLDMGAMAASIFELECYEEVLDELLDGKEVSDKHHRVFEGLEGFYRTTYFFQSVYMSNKKELDASMDLAAKEAKKMEDKVKKFSKILKPFIRATE